ncbi:MAG TPA: hypothetical protein VFW70_00940 [Methylomirabilota bacterium]|nr:hypothetical protein [Methylomirabilota bacterium]
MTDFADVERFGREHADCGGITPSAAAQPGGGFVLTLACACGQALRRAVTMEQAKRPLPLPSRVVTRPAPRPAPAPSADLEAAMRPAVDAEAAAVPPPTEAAPLARASAAPAPAARPMLGPARPAAPRPVAPRKLNADRTIRTALDQQATLAARARPMRDGKPRTRVAWLILFAVLAFGGAGAVYFVGTLDAPPPAPQAAARAPAAAVPPDQQQRAAFEEIVKSLRTLQAASSPDVSFSVYSSRVTFAKADLDRFMPSTAPGPARAAVREALDIHILAMAAWKARTLEQKDEWEAVGQDPAIELCPAAKRVVDFTTQPESGSRAQARGVAVAGAIPLLWECAAAKIETLARPASAAPAAR